MRLQLSVAAALAVVAALASGARAEGELSLRTVYYKERATRVIQPMLDALLGIGDNGTADAHLLADAITSASVAAGTNIEETRYEAGGGYAHQLGDLRLGGQLRYSTEPDYKSAYAGLQASVELLDKNLTLGVAAGAGSDKIDNSGAPAAPRREENLTSQLLSLSVAQLVSENAIASLTYDLSRHDGFTANIYRQVIVGGMNQPETHPGTRLRHAIAATYRQFLPGPATTVIATGRFYTDDWGIRAYTPELRVLQDVGSEDVVFGLRYRFHTQTAADFYRSVYPVAGVTYFTDDPKLSSFRSHTLGARLEVAGAALGFEGKLGSLRGELVIEYLVQDNRFGNAGIAHAALTYPLDD